MLNQVEAEDEEEEEQEISNEAALGIGLDGIGRISERNATQREASNEDCVE